MNAEPESVKTGQPRRPGFDGRKLRELRETRMTAAELARQVGCDRSAIAQFEAGANGPSLSTAASIAQALGVPLTDLMTSSDGDGTAA